MIKKLKEQLNKPLPRNDTGRAAIFGFGGVYLLYSAYQVVRDYIGGVAQMGLGEMLICAGLLVLCALITIGWALYIWLGKKETDEEAGAETAAAEEAEQPSDEPTDEA